MISDDLNIYNIAAAPASIYSILTEVKIVMKFVIHWQNCLAKDLTQRSIRVVFPIILQFLTFRHYGLSQCCLLRVLVLKLPYSPFPTYLFISVLSLCRPNTGEKLQIFALYIVVQVFANEEQVMLRPLGQWFCIIPQIIRSTSLHGQLLELFTNLIYSNLTLIYWVGIRYML